MLGVVGFVFIFVMCLSNFQWRVLSGPQCNNGTYWQREDFVRISNLQKHQGLFCKIGIFFSYNEQELQISTSDKFLPLTLRSSMSFFTVYAVKEFEKMLVS